MNPITCPFCGLATDLPHESQESCIAALHQEIARMRTVLKHVQPTGSAPVSMDEPARHDDQEQTEEEDETEARLIS